MYPIKKVKVNSYVYFEMLNKGSNFDTNGLISILYQQTLDKHSG